MFGLLDTVGSDWHPILEKSLKTMDKTYLLDLKRMSDWLPGQDNLLKAFSMPLEKTRFILLGESPYPRVQSANGYAFWDNAVGSLWSDTGFSKEVNRATSFRNWLKMLLFARGDLTTDYSQQAIACLDKSHFCQTAPEFFNQLLKKGFLLLNASLVFKENEIRFHARQWRPFMHTLLDQLHEYNPNLPLILFGNIAKEIPEVERFNCLISEHPYNISFITNTNVVKFFKPLDLLNLS